MPKVVAFPQQWLAQILSQRVRKAIAEVQSRGMAAALAEIRICLTGQSGLTLGHRLDHKLRLLDEFVQSARA